MHRFTSREGDILSATFIKEADLVVQGQLSPQEKIRTYLFKP